MSIKQLIPDIYALLSEKVATIDTARLANFGVNVAGHLQQSMEEQTPRPARMGSVLYPSDIGKPCLRQIWYKHHTPAVASRITAPTEIKFFMGDFGEELLLYLAKEAGHKVEREQEQVEYEVSGIKIRGRIDAVIDGHIVDVKTTSPLSFGMWNGKTLNESTDKFGYSWQVNAYRFNPDYEPMLRQRSYLFLLDKQNGNLGLAEVPSFTRPIFERRIRAIAQGLDEPFPPPRAFAAEARAKQPNPIHLNIACQYCEFNRECWKEYDITKVARKGKVVWIVAEKEGGRANIEAGDVILTDEVMTDE